MKRFGIRGVAAAGAAALLIALAAGACGDTTPATAPKKSPADLRMDSFEKSLQEVSGTAAAINDHLVALETSVQGRGDGLEGEIKSLRGSIGELQRALDGVRREVASVKGGDADLAKKIDGVSSKLGAVDQRLWVLESRYNDHLRKHHGG